MSASRFVVPCAAVGSVLRDEEIGAVAELINAGALLSQGPWRDRFDQEFAALVGARHAFSVTSGTVALAFAVHLLDLRPGDEVIVTPQTYKATAQPLLDYDVNVRFCDIDSESMNISAEVFADLITSRTRALLLVHYGGFPADMDAIMAIARQHGIVVIEDCAHALGGIYRGQRPGALADIGCFSFHSSKNITTLGEGGMLTFSRDDWAERVARIRSNDADGVYTPATGLIGDVTASRWAVHSGEAYTHLCTEVRYAGSNATLSEAGAAVGLVQLRRLTELSDRRRAIAARLDAVLRRFPGVRVPTAPADVRHAYHLYTFFVSPELGVSRDELLARLEARGVQIQLRYLPLYLLPEWRHRGHRPGECPVAERLWFHEQVNLPCYPALTDAQIEHLVEAVDAVLTEVHEARTASAGSGGMRTWA